MEKKYLEHVRCNLCGADDAKVIYPARYDLEKAHDVVHKFKSSGDERLVDQVVQCRTCGLRYVDPRLKIDLVVKGYSEGSDETFVSQARGREKTFERQLKQIEKHITPGKILDIGTAGGSLLAAAQKRGWNVDGIEPNKWLCKWGKEQYGITIRPGILEDYKFKDNTFDVITLMDVLEHTGNPKLVLEECNRILKPGGVIAVNVPDIDSWLHRVMGRRWVFYLSVHLYYFSHASIKKMLRHAGFTPLSSAPHFQLLEVGYLFFRLKDYNAFLSNLGMRVLKLLHLDKMLIPYWLGQTLFMARKNA